MPRERSNECRADQPSGQWIVRQTAVGILLSIGTAFLFYRSLWGLLGAFVILPLFIRRSRKRWEKERVRLLEKQFVLALQSISSALAAGYSMENAWKNAAADQARLYGEDSGLCMHMRKMNHRMEMNEPLEGIFFDFAAGCGVEDIYNFAEIFCYIKRSGGNMAEVIKKTITRIQEKAEITEQIENAVAAKKMEQKMMNLLLPGVLLFVTITSPSYVSVLYHNMVGILVMSICLAGYVICFFWSEHIVDIKV